MRTQAMRTHFFALMPVVLLLAAMALFVLALATSSTIDHGLLRASLLCAGGAFGWSLANTLVRAWRRASVARHGKRGRTR